MISAWYHPVSHRQVHVTPGTVGRRPVPQSAHPASNGVSGLRAASSLGQSRIPLTVIAARITGVALATARAPTVCYYEIVHIKNNHGGMVRSPGSRRNQTATPPETYTTQHTQVGV